MDGQYLSALTAEYPPSLARSLAELLLPFVSQQGHCSASISDFADFITEDFVPRRLKLCDGAGLNSTADHSTPAPGGLQSLAQTFMDWFRSHDMIQPTLQHLASSADSHPLSKDQQLELAKVCHSHLLPSLSADTALHISPGQPFRLRILQAMAEHIKDPDSALPAILERGVFTGIFEELPTSHQWQQRPPDLVDDSLDDIQLTHCTGNWTQAEKDPALLQALVQKEIEAGHVKALQGGREAAMARWPQRTAIGKLNIVTAEGRDPRLVLDSTICNANTLCRIPEHVSLPSAMEVMRSFQEGDPFSAWQGIALDFKAAHKKVKIHPDEQGTVLFEMNDCIFHYTVCHFGAKFSAYWWARVGGLFTRLLHSLAGHLRHRAWLYVDDLLSLFLHSDFPEAACLLIALLTCLNAPISWKKAQLGHSITWCGWTFDFETEAVHLAHSKLAKLRTILQTLLHRGKIQRKKLEAALGMLMWATTTCQHIRPYLAPLYRDLHSAVGTLKLIHPQCWQPFLDALDNSATVVAQPPGLWLPIKAKVIFAGKAPIKCKQDLPKVTAAHKGTWIRIADPLRSEVHLSSDSKAAIRWIQQCFTHDRLRPLQRPGILACFAAADAMADDHGMGIGGWIVTATHCAWFAESFTSEQIRCFWPQLSGSPQQYIACFETLAQLALAITAHHAMGASTWQFALPAASDNTTAEARTEKLWSTAEPLGTFLKLAAGWAARHHVELLTTHLAGEQNTWADELSRGNTSRFRHRTAERYRLPLQSFMDFTGCIALHPPEAAWPDALTAAQLPA